MKRTETLQAKKRTAKALRSALEKRGIRSIADFARGVPCSRPAVYFALERPDRFPNVSAKIEEVFNA